jgi:peptidoglycan/xylan/chitin deacetylase (PgdA/CDA1 family)
MADGISGVLMAKRIIKRTAGLASVLLRYPTRPATPSACLLVYHRISPVRVTERRLDDWNVRPASLEQHVASLVENSELVFVGDLQQRLRQPMTTKRLVCLTFDDGYQNFHDEALPILRRYHAKATVFVVSGYVGSSGPMPFDRWGMRHSASTPPVAWRPLTWRALEECAKSGLVEVGGHSHSHANAAVTAPRDVAAEPAHCREVIRQRLGDVHARSYAYPYGSSRLRQVTPEYVTAVQAAGFDCAVTTNLGLATPDSDRYQLPRVEVYRSDGPAVVQAKAAGSLAPLYVTDRLRRATR